MKAAQRGNLGDKRDTTEKAIRGTKKERKAINLFLDKHINLLIPHEIFYDRIEHISSAHTSHTTPDHLSKYRTIIALNARSEGEKRDSQRKDDTTPVNETSTRPMNLKIISLNK